MIRSGKIRILSTFIFALALVAQPFSALASTASAASDYPVANSEALSDFSLWSAWDDDATITPGSDEALSGDADYTYVNKSVYTHWGGYESIFPNDGFSTSIDVYLDMAMAETNPGSHFDFSSAINNVDGTHLRDFAFNVGASDGKWYIATSNGADASTSITNETFDAAEVSASGWYTFRTQFDNVDDRLVVSLSVYNRDSYSDEGYIGSWELSDPSDLIGSVVGGHRYSWFVNQPFVNLPVDNATLTTYSDRSITNVDTGETFNTIQQAIDDSDTAPGNTIELEPGVYNENLVVSKAVSLIGPNAGLNPLDGYRDDEATITGQITVLSSGVTIDGLTITNDSEYSGATVKGVHIYGEGEGISGVTVTNNIITDIANSMPAKGSYGVMIQGAVSGITVSNNLITNITSEGWAHGIEVTPSNGVATNPADITVTGNSVSGVSNGEDATAYDFSVDTSDTEFANASQVTFKNNRLSGAVQNLDTDHMLDATSNWWGEGTGTTGPSTSRYQGDMIVSPWCAQAECDYLYSTPGEDIQLIATGGSATTSTYLELKSDGTSGINVFIPEDTTITSSDPLWDGMLNAPGVKSYNVPGSSETALVFSVGSNDHSLILSHAAQLIFPGQAGKQVGFLAPELGSVFTEITAICDMNSDLDTQLGVNGACKMNYGNDLFVFTKHFTTFAAYSTPVATSSNTASAATAAKRAAIFANIFDAGYDDSWMDGANTDDTKKTATVKGDSAGLSSTSTFADASEETATGMAWYWWLLIAALAAAAWPAYVSLRHRFFNS